MNTISKRILALILAMSMCFALSACKKEEEPDPNADPLTLLSQEELIAMVNELNEALNTETIEKGELQAALDARGDTEKGGSIIEMSDGSKRLSFTTVDDMITLPTPWAYPDSSLAPNTSSINICDIVKVKTDPTWQVYLDGSSLILNHIDGISGVITIGAIGKEGQDFKVAELQTYIQDTLFKDFPVENPNYSPLYLAEKQRGVDVVAGTRIDEDESRIRCGIIGYNTTSIQYFFIYKGEQKLIYDEAIRTLLGTMTVRNNPLAI